MCIVSHIRAALNFRQTLTIFIISKTNRGRMLSKREQTNPKTLKSQKYRKYT
jgi:hypothetical protein